MTANKDLQLAAPSENLNYLFRFKLENPIDIVRVGKPAQIFAEKLLWFFFLGRIEV